MREKFDEYVKSRTLQNWKFWIVSFKKNKSFRGGGERHKIPNQSSRGLELIMRTSSV